MIPTSFTLKQNGAHTIMNIIKPNVYMHIIFKIFDGSLIFLNTLLNSVRIGKVEHSLLAMKKVVKDSNLVLTVMDGKNNNFIHCFIKLNHVRKLNALKVLSAPSTMPGKMIKG